MDKFLEGFMQLGIPVGTNVKREDPILVAQNIKKFTLLKSNNIKYGCQSDCYEKTH